MSLLNNFATLFVIAIFIIGIAVSYSYFLWVGADTMPAAKEGFAVARGAGIPDCLRNSQEASDLYALLTSKPMSTEEGPDDLDELKLLLSKLACLKKDLMSPSGIVEATRYQPYNTAHDVEPISETAARCMAKTIPERDLDISIDKWTTRGAFLVKRLCTAVGLTESENVKANSLFAETIKDVSDVARSQCLRPPFAEPGPRDLGGFDSDETEFLRPYDGYY